MLNGNESCVQTFRLLTLPDSLLSNYKALFRIAEVNRPAAARTLFVWFGVAKGKHSESWQPQAMQGQGSGWLVGLRRAGGRGGRGSVQRLQQHRAGRRGGVGSVQVQCQVQVWCRFWKQSKIKISKKLSHQQAFLQVQGFFHVTGLGPVILKKNSVYNSSSAAAYWAPTTFQRLKQAR